MEGGLAAEKRGDWKAAFLLLSPLAQQGNPVAQLHLGYMWEHGLGLSVSIDNATDWYRLSALQGNAYGQVNYGKIQKNAADNRLRSLQGGSVAREVYVNEVIPWFRKSADQGNSDGQYMLGVMHYDGKGVPQNYVEAAKWFKQAADQGNSDGQYMLGVIYFSQYYNYDGRKGVPQDFTEAAKWFKQAADQGNAYGQYMLGVMYYDGRKGVPQDYAEALKWFKQAADQGNADGKKAFATLFIIKPKLAAKKDVGQTVCLPSDDPLGPPSVYGQVEQVHNDKIEVRRHVERNSDQLDWINYNAVFVCEGTWK